MERVAGRFVGLGFPEQFASWGTMLHDASSNVRVS